MQNYDEVERRFSTDFSKVCRTDDGIKYLKVRTLIDNYALKRSPLLRRFLLNTGIRLITVNRKEIQRVRREMYSLVSGHKNLDSIIRNTYIELYGAVNYDRLKESLGLVAEQGDEYWQGWNSVYRDNIRDHVQHHFVRQPSIQDLDTLLEKISKELSPVIRGYIVISWYNQWTSTIVERFFTTHPNVVPTVRRINKVDFFFLDVPIDLKVTFLPDEYIRQVKRESRIKDNRLVVEQVKREPLALAKWLYENQGEPRFSDSNRLFIVLMNENNLGDSWKLKANFNLIENKIRTYLDTTKILPEIKWDFKGDRISGSFETFSDVILITGNSDLSSQTTFHF